MDILNPRLGDFSTNPNFTYDIEYIATIKNNMKTRMFTTTSRISFHFLFNLEVIKSRETK